MDRISNFMKKHPVWFGGIATALFVLVIVLINLIMLLVAPQVNNRVGALAQDIAALVYTFVLLKCIGMFSVLQEKGIGFFRGCYIGLYLIVASIYAIIVQLLMVEGAFTVQSGVMILLFVIDMVLIGFTEEVVFRGVITTNMQQYFGDSRGGIWKSVIASSLLFGFAHITNIVGLSMIEFISRIMFTICLGMILAAIYVRCKNIWTVVFVHALIDFSSEILDGLYVIPPVQENVAPGTDWSFILEDIVYICVVLFLLRKKKISH